VIHFREPPRSGLELAWRLFGIRFRVSPSFFIVYGIIIALLAWPQLGGNPAALALLVALNLFGIGVATLFVGFVQGLVYLSYGLRSTVVAREFMSGTYPEAEPPTALQRIVVALSYAAGCFLLFALIYFSNQWYGWSHTSVVAGLVYLTLKLISLFWGIVALLPIFPYPGGRAMLEVLTMLSPRGGLVATLWLSILLGLAYIAYTAAVYFNKLHEVELVNGVVLPASIILSVFFALSVMNNWQTLQVIRTHRRGYDEPVDDYGEHAPWER
jgi:hypothetical protein